MSQSAAFWLSCLIGLLAGLAVAIIWGRRRWAAYTVAHPDATTMELVLNQLPPVIFGLIIGVGVGILSNALLPKSAAVVDTGSPEKTVPTPPAPAPVPTPPAPAPVPTPPAPAPVPTPPAPAPVPTPPAPATDPAPAPDPTAAIPDGEEFVFADSNVRRPVGATVSFNVTNVDRQYLPDQASLDTPQLRGCRSARDNGQNGGVFRVTVTNGVTGDCGVTTGGRIYLRRSLLNADPSFSGARLTDLRIVSTPNWSREFRVQSSKPPAAAP